MILVKVRCRKCRDVLGEVKQRPPAWDGNLSVRVCGKHTEGAIRHRGFMPWAQSQIRNGGRAPFFPTLSQSVPWADLRRPIEKALQRGGKTQDWPI